VVAVASTVAGGASTVAAVEIGPVEGQALMASMGADLTVIDVRTPEEFAAGHIQGATNIDVEGGGFSAAIEAMDPSKAYLVYCHSGRRAAIAAETMTAAGFTDVRNMGGIQAWIDAGLPVVAG
ncbi:MAG: rhodanese-like domain-containing protein, partial [Ilumatobacteraceae bacterium]